MTTMFGIPFGTMQSPWATLSQPEATKRGCKDLGSPKRPLSNPGPDQGEQDDFVVFSTTFVGVEGLEPPTPSM